MANIYVRSTDGSDSDNGSTWALAKATLAGAAAIDAAGDTIYVSDNHAESTAGTVTLSWNGTLASPTKVICGDDAAEPPTTASTAATATTTGNNPFNLTGVYYIRGIRFNVGSGGSTSGATFIGTNSADDFSMLESCIIDYQGTSSAGRISPTNNASFDNTRAHWKNVDVKFGSTGQRVTAGGTFVWEGGSILSGTSAITSLFVSTSTRQGHVTASGLDLSNGPTGMHIIDQANSTTAARIILRDCKLPASWSGSLFSATPTIVGLRGEMYNCDSGDTNYKLWIEDHTGSIKQETTIIRTGGASDGTTGISWKMVTSANVNYPFSLVSPEIVRWNETTGSSVTVTVHAVHDSQGAGTGSTLLNSEAWLEVLYLGTSGVPLGTHVNDSKANPLASNADQASSSETWTTTGLATPVKNALAVTFTPQEKGFIVAKVHLAKASKTVYVCPELAIS